MSTKEPTSAVAAAATAETSMPVVKVPFPWARLITGTITILVMSLLLISVIQNDNFRWDLVASYLFNEAILQGLIITLVLTVVVMTISIILGVGLAAMRLSQDKLLSGVATVYVVTFRSIPMLALLLVTYNFAALYPNLSLGVPFGPTWFSWNTNDVITPMVAAAGALILHEVAYTTEVIRGGIQAVDSGQREAALAMGMHERQVFRRVILPQAARIIIPPMGNLTIALMKATSLVSVIAVTDLLHAAQLIYSNNYQTIPLLLVACIWYFILTSLLSFAQSRVEKRLARSERSATSRATVTPGGEETG